MCSSEVFLNKNIRLSLAQTNKRLCMIVRFRATFFPMERALCPSHSPFLFFFFPFPQLFPLLSLAPYQTHTFYLSLTSSTMSSYDGSGYQNDTLDDHILNRQSNPSPPSNSSVHRPTKFPSESDPLLDNRGRRDARQASGELSWFQELKWKISDGVFSMLTDDVKEREKALQRRRKQNENPTLIPSLLR